MRIGRWVFSALVALIALFMGMNAALWAFRPERAAELLRMPLLTGDALSSQMDIGAFFFATSSFALLGLATRKPQWLIAGAIMVFGAASYRTIAYFLHDASFLGAMVAIEVFMGTILVLASRVLPTPSDRNR